LKGWDDHRHGWQVYLPGFDLPDARHVTEDPRKATQNRGVMPSLAFLSFKTATSFGISLLGIITLLRLFAIGGPISLQLLPAVLVAGLLTTAGFWRGCLYLRALRSRGGV
jgi:hypothetical protein